MDGYDRRDLKYQDACDGENAREIIFFDELGFGWFVPRYVIDSVVGQEGSNIKEKTLKDLL